MEQTSRKRRNDIADDLELAESTSGKRRKLETSPASEVYGATSSPVTASPTQRGTLPEQNNADPQCSFSFLGSNGLSVEQTRHITDFSKASATERGTWLYARMTALDNAISTLQATLSFSASTEHEEWRPIVEKTVIAVFFSSRTEAYTDHAIMYHIMNALGDVADQEVPPDHTHSGQTFKAFVRQEIQRVRTRIKAAIESSILSPEFRHHQNIVRLSAVLLNPLDLLVTVEACARMALMRSVYIETPGREFWTAIDQQLSDYYIGPNAMHSKRAFSLALANDQARHGDGSDSNIDHSLIDEWQERIDNLIRNSMVPFLTSQVY